MDHLPLFDGPLPEPVAIEHSGIVPRDYQQLAIARTVQSRETSAPGALVRLMTGGW